MRFLFVGCFILFAASCIKQNDFTGNNNGGGNGGGGVVVSEIITDRVYFESENYYNRPGTDTAGNYLYNISFQDGENGHLIGLIYDTAGHYRVKAAASTSLFESRLIRVRQNGIAAYDVPGIYRGGILLNIYHDDSLTMNVRLKNPPQRFHVLYNSYEDNDITSDSITKAFNYYISRLDSMRFTMY